MSFRSEVVAAARSAGGSFKTVEARSQIVGQLADHLQKQNIQIRTLDQLKEKHIRDWIQSMKDKGISDRTLQNRVTAVRGTLRAAGLDRKAEGLQTRQLGIERASRDGSRTAISKEAFQEKLGRVKDEGVRSILELQRQLGLRQREGIMARADTLARWEKELAQGGRIRVLEGTKGGRPRETLVLDREKALAAVWHAKAVAERQGGRLVAAAGLKEAVDRYNNQARAAGFVGKESPHSIRYAFAQASIQRYIDAGLSRREALAMTSLDLGHGDGRGRWVDQVYSR